jgi:hypothetical protein
MAALVSRKAGKGKASRQESAVARPLAGRFCLGVSLDRPGARCGKSGAVTAKPIVAPMQPRDGFSVVNSATYGGNGHFKRLNHHILRIARLIDCGEKGTKWLHVLAQLVG